MRLLRLAMGIALAGSALGAAPAVAAAQAPAAGGDSAPAAPADADADGDGLSDFHERHKYRTDPASADSDGDGVPDGDWDERREYAYTVRTIVQVLPPITRDVLCDDYQDARILEEREGCVDLEVIHYPFGTAAEAIAPDPRWRENARARHARWLRPGLTSSWDEGLRARLLEALEGAGIRLEALDDVETVKKVAGFLLDRAKYRDGFTTFWSSFADGEVRIHPGLEAAAEKARRDAGLSLEEEWQRDLFAKGMFENRTRGSCTSTAIYLAGCLRAVGIPTRLVLAIPIVDASDEREVAMLERLTHHAVRRTLTAAARERGSSWSSHTFNEVLVGGRWRRLNYGHLGQGIFDRQLFGMITHIATFHDWSDAQAAATWGERQANAPRDDVFGFMNPYSTIALSERFGAHARIDNPEPEERAKLTIDGAWWYGAPELPAGIEMRLDDPDTAGHVIVRVREGRSGAEGRADYETFYGEAAKDFVLRAGGRPDVPLRATRGWWLSPEKGLRHFYLRIEPDDLARMAPGVAYALVAPDGEPEQPRWEVAGAVTLTRSP